MPMRFLYLTKMQTQHSIYSKRVCELVNLSVEELLVMPIGSFILAFSIY